MNDVVALVLAGGNGMRFSPITTDKILFPFLDKPFVYYSVGRVLPKEISSVVIIVNEKNETHFRSLQFPVPHVIIKQSESNGMADAIKLARDHIKEKSILLLIADDLFDPDLPTRILAKAKETQASGVLPGWISEKYFPGGYLKISQEKVIGVVEKPGKENVPSPYVYISGQYISDGSLLLRALENVSTSGDDQYEQALSLLMKDHPFVLLPYDGPFASLKYSWHILNVMDILLSSIPPGQGKNVIIKNYVTIEGPVYLGNNVKVMENTKIVGPCYISDNTVVGNNTVIRHSMIGPNCVIGFNTDITRSYIGANCWFHTNYIGDSVLEGNVSMGSGAVLANLRLDEGEISSVVKGQKVGSQRNKFGAIIGSDVRIGVNASIMPGVKIGSGSFIGAGIVVSQDIPDQSFVSAKTELIIEKNQKSIPTDRSEFKKKI